MVNTKLIAGIDEAGRGAVLGPLVVAGVAVYENDIKKLEELGVKDSKLHSPKQRERLAKEIEKIAKSVVVIKVESCKIDSYRKSGTNLNMIEGMKFADVINLIKPEECYIDLPDPNADKFGMFIRKMLQGDAANAKLILEHKADVKYRVVSAASIIAKVERDRKIEELKKKYGDFGPGYPSNDLTIKWLEDWYSEHKSYPNIVRKTWDTAQVIAARHQQKGIGSFLGVFKKKDDCEKH